MGKPAIAAAFILLLILSEFSLVVQVQASTHRKLIVPDQFSTIASALENATDGDTVYVKSGSYSGSELKINKAIALIGEGSTLSLQSERHKETMPGDITGYFTSYWYSRALAVNANGFTLSGFMVVTDGGDVNITGDNNRIVGNTIRADLAIKGSNVTVTENTITNTGDSGVTITGKNCNISNNQISSYLSVYGQRDIFSLNKCNDLNSQTDNSCIYKNTLQGTESVYGNFVVSGQNNIISKNVIANLSLGLKMNGNHNLVLLNYISNCGVGLMPSQNNTLYGNTVESTIWAVSPIYQIVNAEGNRSVLVNNNIYHEKFIPLQGVLVPPYTKDTIDYYDNGVEGNYWSNYQGVDSNGDGYGDTPFNLDPHHIDRHPLTAPFNLSTAAEVVPEWFLTPTVHLTTPTNATTFKSENITVEFSTNKQPTSIGYSLYGKENITTTGNLTLSELSGGLHNLTVYYRDNYGKEASSETVTFTIELPMEFQVLEVAVIAAVVVAVFGILIVYQRKKRISLHA